MSSYDYCVRCGKLINMYSPQHECFVGGDKVQKVGINTYQPICMYCCLPIEDARVPNHIMVEMACEKCAIDHGMIVGGKVR